MQTPVSGRKGILPELPRTLHVESGIVGKYGLPAGDDSAAFSADFVLDVFISRLFYKINLATNKHERTRKNLATEDTEFTEEKQKLYLSVLCALCG